MFKHTRSYVILFCFCFPGLFELFCDFTVSVGVFSIGIDWEYMYYLRGKGIQPKENEIRFGKHWQNLPAEIANYNLLDYIGEYKNEILPKVNQYINTETVKSLHRNLRITRDELISIVLYTDYTELSSDFTSTFRKKWTFEPLSAIKKRHKKYAWWSRELKSAISRFGANYQNGEGMTGPFYTGMSCVMNIVNFNVYLYSPTSTSVHIEVSMKFSGDAGMILEFTNDEGSAKFTKGFDCSIISRYKEEDERYEKTKFMNPCIFYKTNTLYTDCFAYQIREDL